MDFSSSHTPLLHTARARRSTHGGECRHRARHGSGLAQIPCFLPITPELRWGRVPASSAGWTTSECSVKSWGPPLKQNVPRRGEASIAPSARLSALTWPSYVSALFPCPLRAEPGATQVADETGHKLTPPEGRERKGFSQHRATQALPRNSRRSEILWGSLSVLKDHGKRVLDFLSVSSSPLVQPFLFLLKVMYVLL